MGRVTLRDALRLYARHPLFIRLFVWLRHLLSPLERLETLVPTEGKILDLGCGHGLFTGYMALRAPARDILGVDPAPAKIQAARTTESAVRNTRYLLGSIADIGADSRFDTITIVDVLYLLPVAEQQKILEACHRLLADTGVLVLKTQDTRPRWRYWWACVQESLMVGFRMTHGGGLHFLPAAQTRDMLAKAGFTAVLQRLPSRIFYAHIAFICHKKEENKS